jgi:hypothetical protein
MNVDSTMCASSGGAEHWEQILCRVPDYAALSFDFPAFVQRAALAIRHNPVI